MNYPKPSQFKEDLFLLKNGEIAEETSSQSSESESYVTPKVEVKIESKKKLITKKMKSTYNAKDQPFSL